VLHAARRNRLVTFQSMHGVFDRLARRGRPGIRAVRAVLDRWSPESKPTESEMETSVLFLLRRHGLPEPVVQHVVRDGEGRFVGRADLAYPQWKIVIEYDSHEHHTDEWAQDGDASRRNRFAAVGYTLLIARHRDVVAGGHELCAATRAAARTAERASLHLAEQGEVTQVR
jgi:very-short-patch-repair endonuclease